MNNTSRTFLSTFIALASIGLAFAPIPGTKQKVIVVSGTELTGVLGVLEKQFEQENPQIELDLQFQGSQELVNKYLNEQNSFNPTVLIPASGELIDELNQGGAFYQPPQVIARTFLVGIAWPERGKALFPGDVFSWSQLELAMTEGNWSKLGGKQEWGSFDLAITDPMRSNSGQMTLALWTSDLNLSDPRVESLFSLIKRSVYQPPRSTDILLEEFITRGPNDADVAVVYESIALYRWEQSQVSQGNPYQLYYFNPTIEALSTAAIVRRGVDESTAKAASKFIEFLLQPAQQQVFIQYGFRPASAKIDLASVPNSPWSKNIPGVQVNPNLTTVEPPNPQVIGEIQRLWQRSGP